MAAGLRHHPVPIVRCRCQVHCQAVPSKASRARRHDEGLDARGTNKAHTAAHTMIDGSRMPGKEGAQGLAVALPATPVYQPPAATPPPGRSPLVPLDGLKHGRELQQEHHEGATRYKAQDVAPACGRACHPARPRERPRGTEPNRLASKQGQKNVLKPQRQTSIRKSSVWCLGSVVLRFALLVPMGLRGCRGAPASCQQAA